MNANRLTERSTKQDTVWKWLYRVLQGAIIGIGATLPGIIVSSIPIP